MRAIKSYSEKLCLVKKQSTNENSILVLIIVMTLIDRLTCMPGQCLSSRPWGWNTYLAIFVLLAVTAAYTIVGEFKHC